MASHLFLADNLYNERQDRARAITANEEAVGYDVWHLGTGRRNPDDRWQAITPNTQTWVRVDAGASVPCDTIAIDRGHNWAGKVLRVQRSADLAFTTPIEVIAPTLPSSASASTLIDATNGAYTEEGAWIKRFTEASSRYWRVLFDAYASTVPQIVGLFLGKAFSPAFPTVLPHEDEVYRVGFDTSESDFGWRSGTVPFRRREGTIRLRLSASEEAVARDFYLEITRRRPFWLVSDTSKAEQTVLAALPPQSAQRLIDRSWFPHQISFQWEEHEAVLP